VKNSSKKAKTVLMEYPIDPAWTLVSPKEPAEKTAPRIASPSKPSRASRPGWR